MKLVRCCHSSCVLAEGVVSVSIISVRQMTSVERILQYTRLEQEGHGHSDDVNVEQWPVRGSVVFDQVSLQYFENSPPVLKNINLRIEGGEKVCVITYIPVLDQ